MYLIVGLGNPEPEYSKTRHNMGFDVINKLAKQYEIELSRSNFEGIYGTGIIENEKVILLKPQTYMNLSGQSIKKYIDFYKIPLENILVVFDDMDTEKGKIKIRKMYYIGFNNNYNKYTENKIKIYLKKNKKTDKTLIGTLTLS